MACQSDFNINLMFSTILAAHLLMRKTTPNKTLLFIGNTPNYLYHIVRQNGRNAISVPFSGRPYDVNRTSKLTLVPTPSQIENYTKLLASLGVTAELVSSENIILVDFTPSGKSSKAFVETLRNCFKLGKVPIDMILVFGTSLTTDPRDRYLQLMKMIDHSYINIIGILGWSYLDKVANDKYPRTVPFYPVSEWNNPPKVIEDTSCLDKLLYFYNLLLCSEAIAGGGCTASQPVAAEEGVLYDFIIENWPADTRWNKPKQSYLNEVANAPKNKENAIRLFLKMYRNNFIEGKVTFTPDFTEASNLRDEEIALLFPGLGGRRRKYTRKMKRSGKKRSKRRCS